MVQANTVFIAKTMYGLEEVLAEELTSLGGKNVKAGNRLVEFEGDLRTLYTVNLWSRLALRILVPVSSFDASDEEDLYTRVRRVDWSKYLTHEQTLAIDAVAFSNTFRHSKYVALKSKDAIVDQFRDKTGRRPSVDKTRPTIRIHIHIDRNRVNMYLDSGAESLHRRGYRTGGQEAPLSEVLAAGLIMLSNWDGKQTLLDPMCGSGTLPIEAATMAAGMTPRLENFPYGFKRWNNFDKDLWEEINDLPRPNGTEIRLPDQPNIFGSDRSPLAIQKSELHAEMAGVKNLISFQKANFHKLEPPAPKGIIIMNPPYGERIEVEKIPEFYAEIGDTLKQNWIGWTAHIFAGNPDGLKSIGLRTSARKKLFNGSIECRLCQYDIFASEPRPQE